MKFKKHTNIIVSNALRTLWMIKKSFGKITSQQFLNVYKTYIRPKIEFANSISCPSGQAEIDLLEKVQKQSLHLIKWTRQELDRLPDMSYGSKLSYLSLTTLKTRRSRGYFIELYKNLHGYYDIDPSSLFTMKTEQRTRTNHSLVLYKQKTRPDISHRSDIESLTYGIS